MSFWSLVLDHGKKYEKTVENGIQVTRAVLDTSRATGSNDGLVQVILDFEGQELCIANLSSKHGIFQTTLDLTFREGDRVGFSTSGAKIPVTLTGLAGLDEDEELDEEELEDLDEDYMEAMEGLEDEEDEPVISKKRKLEIAEKYKRPTKSAKMDKDIHKHLAINGETFPSDDDEEEDEHYNPTVDMSSMGEDMLGDIEEDDSDLDDEEDDGSDEEGDEEVEDEEDDEDISEDESEEEEEQKPIETVKKSKMNGAAEHLKKKDISAAANMTPKQAKQVEKLKAAAKEGGKTPTKEGKTPTKAIKTPGKEGKQAAKEAKSPKAAAVQPKAETPKPKKSDNKENLDKTPKSEKKKKKQKDQANQGTPSGKQNSESVSKKQMRAGGVMVEDINAGSGEAARKGSQVSMYYVGRLKSNNKQFDACQSGQPFKFVLGRGEVIQGWDVGLMGMKVGGKRKLSIPSSMAYGKRGAPPAIPPQAHLEFTVTMMGCR